MKGRFIFLLIAFLLLSSFTIAALAFDEGWIKWPALTMIGGMTLLMLIMTFMFLQYAAGLIRNGSSAQDKGRIHSWSFNNLTILESTSRNMARKTELLKQYVYKLGDPGGLDNMDELVKHDSVGKALQEIHRTMTDLALKEGQRKWMNEGIAQFSEIFRDKGEFNSFCDRIISKLAKYINACQGALFVEYTDEHEHRYLQMISCYAYEKRKDESVRISEGQGRLGQCMVEKEFVFLTDIPSNYLNISSGLGHALPRSVVVVPLMLNEKFYGAIELAFFQILKPHEIEFLKRLSENIAAEISSMQSIQQTQRFLKESESLTLELKQHEAEMQHHLKELEETQEQMQKKQRELNSYLAAINNTIASVEFNMEGHFVNANEIFLKVMGYTMNDLAGRSYQKLFSEDGSMNLMWQNLKEGKFFSGEFKMKDKNGKDIWLSGTFNPIAITNSCPEKVMMFAQFTTQEKEKLHELNAVVNALKATLPVVEFNENFTCKTANEKFLKLFDVTRISLKNKNITDFLDPSYHNVFHKMSAEILSNDFSTIMLPVIIKGRPATFEASISVVHQSENLISRIIVILVKPIEERISEITSAV